MTQDEKRIKLAEAAGWKVHPKDRFIVIPPNSPHSVQPLFTIPDYFNDLNVVHELWASLPRATRLIVVARLADILKLPKGNQNEIGELEEALFSASAAQRATAIGLTLNLWK